MEIETASEIEWLTDEIFVWPIAQNSGRCNHEYELSPGFLGCYPLCLSRHRPGHRQTIWRYIFSLNLNPKIGDSFSVFCVCPPNFNYVPYLPRELSHLKVFKVP